MPILKGEASHYDSDLHNLLFCCQCVDAIFYSEDLKEVAEAHRIVLCSVSHVFMLLFNVKSPDDIQDSSIIRIAQTLFAVNQEAAHPVSNQRSSCNSPVRVIVKDSFFCSCLSDILHFIYSGILVRMVPTIFCLSAEKSCWVQWHCCSKSVSGLYHFWT